MKKFKNEKEFEDAIIQKLTERMNQWDSNILEYKNEVELIENWKRIIEKNNCDSDRLNGTKLTMNEMQKIMNYFSTQLKTPFAINEFLNSEATVLIERDEVYDTDNKVSLKLFNKKHIAGGETTYQIARQTIFQTDREFNENNRGDLTLLINGMPLIHIELKNDSLNGDKIKEGVNQIKKYKHEGSFNNFFSLIQLFVVMTPTKMKYFANVDSFNQFNDNFIFNWANEKNEIINNWEDVCETFLSIPMAHYLISYFSVGDGSDKTLKVLRSYQCHAANKILEIVKNRNWDSTNTRGGFIYHTTGSGKTLTCFKVAQLINSFTSVDKIIFLFDEIQLYEQAYEHFVNFSDLEVIGDTKSANDLLDLLRTQNKTKIIITSIQKMSLLVDDNCENSLHKKIINDLKNNKKIVFIVDEAHRTTNGTMLANIKRTYKHSLLFGFTGTPIFEKNCGPDKITTTGLFGDELHRYTMLSAIEDGNVLEVKNTQNVTTYNLEKIKHDIAKIKFSENSVDYCNFINSIDQLTIETTFQKELADFYNSIEHKKIVVDDIIRNFKITSFNGFFHHILATTSIKNAIEYYRMFKENNTINIAILFDNSDNNSDMSNYKNDAIEEILIDYSKKYNKNVFDFKSMKKDIISNLKRPNTPINLIIVVDQLLTGFDSKYINYVYLDKVLSYERIIQTASRTNRILSQNDESKKMAGFLKCYQRTELMKKNLKDAAELFISPNNINIFESKLKSNLLQINDYFYQIKEIFNTSNIFFFEKLPNNPDEQIKFSKLFIKLKKAIDRSIPELFNWNDKEYNFENEETIKVDISKKEFDTLVQRFIEVPKSSKENNGIYLKIESDRQFNNGYNLDKINLNELLKNNEYQKTKKAIASLPIWEQEQILKLLGNTEIINDNFNINNYLWECKNRKKQAEIQELKEFCDIDVDLCTKILNKNYSNDSELFKTNDYDKLIATINPKKAAENVEKKFGYSVKNHKINATVKEHLINFLTWQDVDLYKTIDEEYRPQ